MKVEPLAKFLSGKQTIGFEPNSSQTLTSPNPKTNIWITPRRVLSSIHRLTYLFPHRDEHRARGDRRPPRRDALLRPVSDQQPRRDGLRQPGEGQPRGSPGDGQAEGRPAGEAGVHHGVPAGEQQQQLLLNATSLNLLKSSARKPPGYGVLAAKQKYFYWLLLYCYLKSSLMILEAGPRFLTFL